MQFHQAHESGEFGNIMTLCQDIVFGGQATQRERDHDDSDSGESEINWQMQALDLADDEDSTFGDQDIPDNTLNHFDNFGDNVLEDSIPSQSNLSSPMPATPEQAPRKQLNTVQAPLGIEPDTDDSDNPLLLKPATRKNHSKSKAKQVPTLELSDDEQTTRPEEPPLKGKKPRASKRAGSSMPKLPALSLPPSDKKGQNGKLLM